MSLHIHRVATRPKSRTYDGRRWCFRCRAVRPFTRTIHVPIDPESYYGPHVSIECGFGHSDGDLFPGRTREYE